NVTTAIKDLIGNRLTAPYTQSFSLSTEQPPAGDGTGFISGEVYDATTGRPLPGASITIEVPATAFAKTQQPNNPTTQQLKRSTTQELDSLRHHHHRRPRPIPRASPRRRVHHPRRDERLHQRLAADHRRRGSGRHPHRRPPDEGRRHEELHRRRAH